LSAEEGTISVTINELIRERTKQLWVEEPYKSAKLQTDLTLDDEATVRTSPEWLRRALDILIDNAINAIADTPFKQITVSAQKDDKQVEIRIMDTGKGIPERIIDDLFQKPIQKEKGVEGLGMGLLIAQAIVQTYGGDIGVEFTGSTGTTMLIRLPMEV
jgi:signal transduction histidine kinase